MLSIGIDIMGGDQAPRVVLEGSLRAMSRLQAETRLVFFGPESVISSYFEQHLPPNDRWLVEPCGSFIAMNEHPVKALQAKPDSTIGIGVKALSEGRIEGFASAGHSGALMVAAYQALGTAPGIDRPSAAVEFPQKGSTPLLLLDVGINVDIKALQFVQLARLGAQYFRSLYGREEPRIKLLNTGSEPGKGSLLYQNAHRLLANTKGLNFAGNIEARDLWAGLADVVVCDGFTGNALLKNTEGLHQYLHQSGVRHSALEALDYRQYGGTPVLGLRGNVVLGHGVSDAMAIANMILTTEKIATRQLADKIHSRSTEYKWQ